jgi:hypothetical protein
MAAPPQPPTGWAVWVSRVRRIGMARPQVPDGRRRLINERDNELKRLVTPCSQVSM